MRNVLRKKFADLITAKGISVVFDTMDPSYVGALGAARAVRAKVGNSVLICDVIDPIDLSEEKLANATTQFDIVASCVSDFVFFTWIMGMYSHTQSLRNVSESALSLHH